ncbi:hypothetical protein EVAR_96951_1 [Eumeta japonica]|uniref:Uncharacterized protein n=1 Tax=Eumeta variegata TaxID=151549 RepID=A0A4C1VCT5_EUMVA|nr:hypothetical protein EVAR_96951_1 [Eumeta japonica]
MSNGGAAFARPATLCACAFSVDLAHNERRRKHGLTAETGDVSLYRKVCARFSFVHILRSGLQKVCTDRVTQSIYARSSYMPFKESFIFPTYNECGR